MTESAHEYVTRAPGSGWRVADTRISLDSIVHAYWSGRQPEAIVADSPSMSIEPVHGALAFYLRHQLSIDRYLLEQDKRWGRRRQESETRHGPLLQRIAKSGNQAASAEMHPEQAAGPGVRGIWGRARQVRIDVPWEAMQTKEGGG
jgi:uncharacterized protein (DUF433 family)